MSLTSFLPRSIFLMVMILPLIGCHDSNKHHPPAPNSLPYQEQLLANTKAPVYHFKIINSYPHDKRDFTEGILLDNGYLYESTGLYQQSKLEKKDLMTGKVFREYVLPENYFAEGIAVIGNYIYQLTYQENTGFVYDKNTFKLK